MQPPPKSDFSTVEAVNAQLLDASDTLSSMTETVAAARQVKEYDSERRKRALALAVREFLIAGDSASAAETKGRASAIYGEALDRLSAELLMAEKTIAEHEAARVRWDSARTVSSSLRAIAANV